MAGRVTTVRTLYRCEVSAIDHVGANPGGVTFTLEGDGFLYHMVRIIVRTWNFEVATHS